MTYVSRGTRITVSRWLDVCDPEYRIRMCRTRSDGRLKKYSSAEDLRAWVSDNCMKSEYFVDLMSDGEISGKQPFRLYGRFIPVPILFKLIQNTNTREGRNQGNVGRRSKSGIVEEYRYTYNYSEPVKTENLCENGVPVRSNASDLYRAQWEKNKLQKNLLECTCLLNRAVEKLEKINTILGNDRQDHSKPKFSSSCSAVTSSNPSEFSTTRSCVNQSRDAARCNELMRKISNLRAKLKKLQEYRQEINIKIRNSRQRLECASSNSKLTQIFNREEEVELRKQERKLEKLIAERGKLLSQMCDALICLNNLKKSSMNFRRKNSQSTRNRIDCGRGTGSPGYGCRSCFRFESSDGFGSESSLSDCYEKPHQKRKGINRPKSATDSKQPLKPPSTQTSKNSHTGDSSGKSDTKTKKSKVKFVCPQRSCPKVLETDDISSYENKLTPKQRKAVSEILQNIQPTRPSTSPTTKVEWREASASSKSGRRIKSETTMKDIEKTLRNYEYRLCVLDDLDRKMLEVKQKISESKCLKKNLERIKMEAQVQREVDREKSEREMSKLCSENWELKKQLERLTTKFNAQTKRIQSLKCGVLKARELEMGFECQAQELKKKLSEYQEGFEHQRKCISKWENVVAEQRTEIENLMNHIRMLTKTKKEENLRNQEKNVPQKTRPCLQDVSHRRRTWSGQKSKCCVIEVPSVSSCMYCCPNFQHRCEELIYQQKTYNADYCSDDS